MSYKDYERDYKQPDHDNDFDGCLRCFKRPDKNGKIIHKVNCCWAIENKLPREDNSVKCRFCGEVFAINQVIKKQDHEDREHSDERRKK